MLLSRERISNYNPIKAEATTPWMWLVLCCAVTSAPQHYNYITNWTQRSLQHGCVCSCKPRAIPVNPKPISVSFWLGIIYSEIPYCENHWSLQHTANQPVARRRRHGDGCVRSELPGKFGKHCFGPYRLRVCAVSAPLRHWQDFGFYSARIWWS